MKKLHISQRTMIVIGFLLLAVSVSLTAGVYARYVASAKSDNRQITAKTFYFTSNYLTENNHEYKLNAGTNSVTIELYNYDCENPLLISEVDCSYSVTVTPLNADNDVLVSADSYTAPADTKTNLPIKISGLDNGNSYTVEVTSTGGKYDSTTGTVNTGYVKTLSATFTVADTTDGFYMNVDDTDPHYIVLTVWTENITGDVTVTFPAGLIPDTTNPRLAGVKNYQATSYIAGSFKDADSFGEPYSSYSYRFFKTSEYNSGGFTVTITYSQDATKTVNQSTNIP